MDWALAIDRNRAALVAVTAAVAALVGEGGPVSRRLRNAALALLRPAEAALRRLIVIAARGLVVAPAPARAAPALGRLAGRRGATGRPPAFRLFDPPRRFGPMVVAAPPRGLPRIRTFWGPPSAQPIGPPSAQPVGPPSAQPIGPAPAATPPAPMRPDPDALVDALRLRLRLRSLERALADLPGQARRLARWRARRRAASAPGLARSPLRPGRPPGHRRRPDRDVDLVLRECHALARDALAPDTS